MHDTDARCAGTISRLKKEQALTLNLTVATLAAIGLTAMRGSGDRIEV